MNVLITAGPTYEPIDAVRYIGNFSTGKMGMALAKAFADEGTDVNLIMGPSTIATRHPRIHRTDVMTADEMYDACMRYAKDYQIAILSAAVADYKPTHVHLQKIKKNSNESLTLELIKNKDILAALGKIKQHGQILGGFSLETHNEKKFAREKRIKKNCDFIVMNSLRDKGAGFATDTNKVSILWAGGEITLPLAPKKEIARNICNFVFENFSDDFSK